MAKSSTAAPRLDHFFSAVGARLDLWRDLNRATQGVGDQSGQPE